MLGYTELLSTFKSWTSPRRQQPLPVGIQRYLDAPQPDMQLPWRAVPYTVLDIETTGLNPRRDAMLSIGMVEIENGRIQLDRRWYTLLRPPDDIVVSPESIRIHGLFRSDVAHAPSPLDVLPELLSRLCGRVLIVHFAPIDIDFLNRALRSFWGITLRGPALDTVLLAQTLYHHERWTAGDDGMNPTTALCTLAEQAGLPIHAQHNALGDALTTAQLFLSQATRMERRGMSTLRKLLNAGRCLR